MMVAEVFSVKYELILWSTAQVNYKFQKADSTDSPVLQPAKR